jgi:hypothetical protein
MTPFDRDSGQKFKVQLGQWFGLPWQRLQVAEFVIRLSVWLNFQRVV